MNFNLYCVKFIANNDAILRCYVGSIASYLSRKLQWKWLIIYFFKVWTLLCILSTHNSTSVNKGCPILEICRNNLVTRCVSMLIDSTASSSHDGPGQCAPPFCTFISSQSFKLSNQALRQQSICSLPHTWGTSREYLPAFRISSIIVGFLVRSLLRWNVQLGSAVCKLTIETISDGQPFSIRWEMAIMMVRKQMSQFCLTAVFWKQSVSLLCSTSLPVLPSFNQLPCIQNGIHVN